MFSPVKKNGIGQSIEPDTGSAVTILSRAAWQRIGVPILKPRSKLYRSFTGQPIILLMGVMTVEAQYSLLRGFCEYEY